MVQLKIKLFTTPILILMVLSIGLPATTLAQTTNWEATPLYHIRTPDASPAAIAGYSPSFIIGAYNLQSSNGGSGTTIAIVDAYNDPNVASNLATFSTQFGLPTANLQIHKMSSSIQSSTSWAVEISLDVEWAHAIAPQATILLVEATTNSMVNLMSAVSYATSSSTPTTLGIPKVVAVSMSWGGSESSTETAYDSYFASPSITFFASSGDTGGAVLWPSSSVNVVSVGGTTLTQGTIGYTETAWSGSGGGVSAYESAPSDQSGLGYSKRATPDVSYNADPNTGFSVYDNYGYSGWFVVGGTSAGAPQWAAIQALENTVTSSNLYAAYNSPSVYSADFRDITTGTAGSNKAGAGYDLVTGIGSPLTTNFAAPATPDFSLSAPSVTIPASQTMPATGQAQVTVSSIDGYSGSVALTVSDTQNWASATTSPNPVTGSGTAVVSITVPALTVAGTTDTVTVTGTDSANLLQHSTTFTVTVSDFSVSASPSSINVPIGGQGVPSTIKVTALDGFTGTVNLQLPATLPTGFTATLSTGTITIASGQTSGTATLTVTATSGATGGTVTVTGTSGTLSHMVVVTVTATSADFSLSANPASLSIRHGYSGKSTITVTSIGGYTGSTTLSASGMPTGMTATFSTNPVRAGSSSTMTLITSRNTVPGNYPIITVTGTNSAAGLTHKTTISVTVT